VGAVPPRTAPGSRDGKEGAPLGDDNDRNNADAAAFASGAETMTTTLTRRRRRRRMKQRRDTTNGTLTMMTQPLCPPLWCNQRRQRLRQQCSGQRNVSNNATRATVPLQRGQQRQGFVGNDADDMEDDAMDKDNASTMRVTSTTRATSGRRQCQRNNGDDATVTRTTMPVQNGCQLG
jgi:hypothetical protein